MFNYLRICSKYWPFYIQNKNHEIDGYSGRIVSPNFRMQQDSGSEFKTTTTTKCRWFSQQPWTVRSLSTHVVYIETQRTRISEWRHFRLFWTRPAGSHERGYCELYISLFINDRYLKWKTSNTWQERSRFSQKGKIAIYRISADRKMPRWATGHSKSSRGFFGVFLSHCYHVHRWSLSFPCKEHTWNKRKEI